MKEAYKGRLFEVLDPAFVDYRQSMEKIKEGEHGTKKKEKIVLPPLTNQNAKEFIS
jgi:hypothetical protein